MSYMKSTYRFENAIEIEEHFAGRYGAPGMGRRQRQKPTPEQMEKINQRNRETVCRRKLRANFREHDLFVTLTYRREARPPDMEGAKKDFQRFARHLRKEYREAGSKLKFIRNIECGTKGAWHIHIVVNRIQDADIVLKRAWPYGKVTYQLLYEKGEFRDLAAYITKTPATDPRLSEANYSTSRNLPVPKPAKRLITSREIWQEPKLTKKQAEEWYIDRESIHEGLTRYGQKYRQYTLLRYHRRN